MKSVNADEFYERLKDYAGFKSKEASKDVFFDVSEFIRGLLLNGQAVKIPGVGRLEPVTLAPEWCGIGDDKKQVGERKSVRFVISKKLKKELRK